MVISQSLAPEPREVIDLFLVLKQTSPWANICWKAGRDQTRANCCHPLHRPTSTPRAGPVCPRSRVWVSEGTGRAVEALGLGWVFCSAAPPHWGWDRILHRCTAGRFAPLSSPLQALQKQPLPSPRDSRGALPVSAQLSPPSRLPVTPAVCCKCPQPCGSGLLTWTCPAGSFGEERPTNKQTGCESVCEQTVSCDGASFNLQIHPSTERRLQIDRPDQKETICFKGSPAIPQTLVIW